MLRICEFDENIYVVGMIFVVLLRVVLNVYNVEFGSTIEEFLAITHKYP